MIVDRDGRVRVTDFGIARAGASEITQTGSVMGTPHYLSPEQAQGLDVTPVSDLYSIGVILYEVLTGRVPFEGDSAVAVAMKQVSEQPRGAELDQPGRLAGARRGRDAGAGEGPRQALPARRGVLAALDAAEADPTGADLSDTALLRRRRRSRTPRPRRRRRRGASAAGAGSSSACWRPH